MKKQQALYLVTQFLTEAALAERWCLTTRGLKAKRLANPETVPPFLKISNSGVRYPIETVIDFEQNLIKQNQRA